jgi:hypothetical protein
MDQKSMTKLLLAVSLVSAVVGVIHPPTGYWLVWLVGGAWISHGIHCLYELRGRRTQ